MLNVYKADHSNGDGEEMETTEGSVCSTGFILPPSELIGGIKV